MSNVIEDKQSRKSRDDDDVCFIHFRLRDKKKERERWIIHVNENHMPVS